MNSFITLRLLLERVAPSLVLDWALVLAEFHVVPVSPLLQRVRSLCIAALFSGMLTLSPPCTSLVSSANLIRVATFRS